MMLFAQSCNHDWRVMSSCYLVQPDLYSDFMEYVVHTLNDECTCLPHLSVSIYFSTWWPVFALDGLTFAGLHSFVCRCWFPWQRTASNWRKTSSAWVLQPSRDGKNVCCDVMRKRTWKSECDPLKNICCLLYLHPTFQHVEHCRGLVSHRAAVFDAEATTWFPGTISSFRTTEDGAQIFDITRGTNNNLFCHLRVICNAFSILIHCLFRGTPSR